MLHADLRKAGAVKGGIVVVAYTVPPGRFHGVDCFLFRNIAEHIAERGCAEAEPAWQNILKSHWLILWLSAKAMHETLLFAGWVTTGTRPVRPHRPAASREFELHSLVLYRALDDRQCYPDW